MMIRCILTELLECKANEKCLCLCQHFFGTLRCINSVMNHQITMVTPYNVGSVLWRLFSTLEVVQYIGGCSVHRGDNISTVGDSFSTVGDNISTCGGITSVKWGDNISTVEGIQYSGGRILISACLVINHDEDIDVFCITIRNFHSEVFRKFKQISCMLRAGLVYSRSNLVSK